MQCFNHQDSPAVCACAVCFKGMCQNCMQPSAERFVCSPACDEYHQKISKINNASIKIYGFDKPRKHRRLGFRTAIMYLCFGIPALFFSVYEAINHSYILETSSFWFLIFVGLAFTILGFRTYKHGIRL